MIEVKNLTKVYGSHTAVDNVSFKIEKGHIYGFLGPNGAGKSTTMNIITGCLSATSGNVLVNGNDIFDQPYKAKCAIGYLPEIPPLYTDMTPFEYLMFVAEAKAVPANQRYVQVREVIEITGLESYCDRIIKNLSKGYKQRVGIAQAMLGNPDIIILDEPTVGLDPKQIIEIRDLIRELGKIKTVVLSSHILAEVASVCDIIIIISHGKIVANDTTENLVSGFSELSGYEITLPELKGEAEERIIDALDSISGTECECKNLNGETRITINISSDIDLREAIFDAITSNGAKLLELKRRSTTLEDVFLRLTSEPDLGEYQNSTLFTDSNDGDGEDGGEDENDTDKVNEKEEDDYKPLFSVKEDDEE